MIVVLVVFAWMPMARLVRGAVLSIKENEYVLAARTLGATSMAIIGFHIIPNVLGPLIVNVTLNTGEALLVETALSFLGLGIQPPTASWGNMLQNAFEIVSSAPTLAVAPGLMIFSVVLAVNFIGDGLRDALDPKAIRR
jgi:peptide/nickel transport system permease protein